MPTTPILELPYPTSLDSADVPRDLQALAEKLDPLGFAPVGAMMMWPAVNAPAGVDGNGNPLWFVMLGQVLPAASYPGLATVLGQSGGNITIPDMRNLFPIGAGAAAMLATGGAATVALATNELPAHAHGVNDPSHVHAMDAQGWHAHGGATAARDRSQAHGHSIQSSWAIYNANGGTSLGFQAGGSQFFRAAIGADAADPADHLHGIAGDGSHAHNIDARYTGVTIQNAGGGAAHENRPPFRAINFIIRAG